VARVFWFHRTDQDCAVLWKVAAQHARYVEQGWAPANQTPVVGTVTDNVALSTQDGVLQGNRV
jgi:hypothetical protein